MYKEKLEMLFADEAFKEQVKNVKSIEEMQKLFADHGVDFSEEELTRILESCEKLAFQENEELDDEQMEDVAGGFDPVTVYFVSLGISLVAGLAKELLCKPKKRKK